MAGKPDGRVIEAYISQNIGAKVRAALAILLSNCVEFWSDGYWPFDIERPEEMESLRRAILEDTADLDRLVSLEGDDAIAYTIKLRERKGAASAAFRALQAYSEQLQFMAGAAGIMAESVIRGEKKEPLFDKDAMLSDCAGFVGEALNDIGARYRRSLIISCFPVRMASGAFGDYVHSGITHALSLIPANDAAERVSYMRQLREQLSPAACEGYGRLFPDMARSVDGIDVFLLETREALEEAISRIEALLDKIMPVADYLMLLFESANALMILSLFGVKPGAVTEGDFAFNDAYNTVTENILSPEREAFGERVSLLLEQCLERLMDDVAKQNEKCEKLLSKGAVNITGEGERLLKYRAVADTLFYEHIRDFEDDAGGKEAAQSEDGQIARGFIEFMEGVLSEAPPKKRRFMRQRFISGIMCPMDSGEFLNYVKEAVLTAEGEGRLTPCAARLGAIFDAAGYEASSGSR